MRFGQVSTNQLPAIDFSLPQDAWLNRHVLNGQASVRPVLYTGCGRWGMREWIGSVYPPAIKEKNYPEYYIQHFNCIELNATLYRLYPKQSFEQWAAWAGNKPFKYSPKLPATIIDALQGKTADVTSDFFAAAEGLGDHLGICFLQLGEWTTASLIPALSTYIQQLPLHFPVFIELRHGSWFEPDVQTSFFRFLQQSGTGLIITDTPGRRDVLHMCLTVRKTCIRFVGSRSLSLDYRRLNEWIQRLQYWFENGLEEVYFIMHAEVNSAALADYLKQRLQRYYVN